MTQPSDVEARLSRAEADAVAARHLAAAHDRDLSDLGVRVDANRRAINAPGEQARARFDEVDRRSDRLEQRVDLLETKVDAGFAYMQAQFAEMSHGFAAVRHGSDQTAAGFARIAELIAARDDDRWRPGSTDLRSWEVLPRP